MTVYVLLVAYEYEGCELLGVYASEAEAQAAFDVHEQEEPGGDCVIQDRVLGAPADARY